jgi:hypothetical protein
MPDPEDFKLDDEHCNRVQDCLNKASLSPEEPFEKFVGRIEMSIRTFYKTEPDATLREAHDALRALWHLSHDPDPSVGQLRARLKKLPRRALRYVEDRAEQVIPRLFPGHSCDGGFLAWADTASSDMLLRSIRALSAEGGRIVPGRTRPAGRQARQRMEPVILGQARGASDDKPKGGRPRENARHNLVMHLALDWYLGTGVMPEPGRSDSTGFGELVHSVFDWLEEPGATRALRDYWREVEEGRRVNKS